MQPLQIKKKDKHLTIFHFKCLMEIYGHKKDMSRSYRFRDALYWLTTIHCIERQKCLMLMSIIVRSHFSVICGGYNNRPLVTLWAMVFDSTFNNISAISWRSVLLVEETGYPEKTTDPLQPLVYNILCGGNTVICCCIIIYIEFNIRNDLYIECCVHDR